MVVQKIINIHTTKKSVKKKIHTTKYDKNNYKIKMYGDFV